MGKIFKTKLYRVTYKNDHFGSDHFYGKYILEHDWLLNQIKNGDAFAEKVN